MLKNIGFVSSLTVALVSGAAVRSLAQEAPKPTVAIADVAVSPGAWTLPPPQLGAAIIQLLVDELVSARQFHVFDGEWLVPESETGGRVNVQRLREAATAKQVDYIVLGAVTAFSTSTNVSRAGGILPRPMGMGGYSRSGTQTAVAINFRIVDVRTGEIVTTAAAQGIGKRHSTGLGLLGIFRGLPLPIAAAAASHDVHARDAMLDEALRAAVHNAAQTLAQGAARLSAATEHQSTAAR
jgi:curli biogenesis system outer membrane secretion channel CsgG